MPEEPEELALELERVELEVAELEGQLAQRRAWEAEARALSTRLRRQRLQLTRRDWAHEARVGALAAASTLIIAGAFAIDPELGAFGTATTFAVLIWEAVK